ncbi:hypothetical protein GQ56_0104765 [Burkholderia paludis]|nr:hypothetical protein GQ56_0104765 [Burkholderia paludis]
MLHDETPRPDASLAKMATLEPLLPGGSLTAAVASQTGDAAARAASRVRAALRAGVPAKNQGRIETGAVGRQRPSHKARTAAARMHCTERT